MYFLLLKKKKNNEKKRFFEDFPPFWNFCMNFICWGSGYIVTVVLNIKLFASSVSDGPSWRNHLCKRPIPTFRRVVFARHFCIQKLCKINKKKEISFFSRVCLLSPTSFISIFILATSKKIFKNSLFLGGA